MKKMLGLLIVLVAACGCVSPEPEKVQAIQFVPQDEAPETANKTTR